MKHVRNERGIALVTALLLALIALAIVLAVLYLITQGIQTSASHKRYRNSIEASYGGVEVFTKEVIPQIFRGDKSSADVAANFSFINLAFDSAHPNCLYEKLTVPTSSWSTSICGDKAAVVNPERYPDATFLLKGLALQPNFKVYTQIVDSVPGNSDTSGYDAQLDGGGGVVAANSGINPQHIPGLYTIEVQGQRDTTKTKVEKARLSVLYAF